MSRMSKLALLLPRILPQVLPCPKSMALDALQMLAMEFCRETGVWLATFQESICPCETVIALDLPQTAVVASVSGVWLNDSLLDGSSYEVTGREITLSKPVEQVTDVIVKASLRPLRWASELPEDILEEYGDTLVFGAIAKLKAMSGQKVEWNDPQGMAVYYQLYNEGSGKAKARKFRKRFGSGVLYVNTGDE